MKPLPSASFNYKLLLNYLIIIYFNSENKIMSRIICGDEVTEESFVSIHGDSCMFDESSFLMRHKDLFAQFSSISFSGVARKHDHF